MVRIGFGVVLSLSILSPFLFANPGDENQGSNVASHSLPKPDLGVLEAPGCESQASSYSSPVKSGKRRHYENRGNETDEELSLTIKKQKRVEVSPTSLKTPMGGLKKRFLGVRRRVARSLALDVTADDKDTIKTPEQLKAVYQETFPSNHFTHAGTFEGVPYYLDLRLFDPQQVVMRVTELSVDLETNLERMQRGCAPLSYKVSSSVEQYLDDPIVVGDPNLPWGIDYVALLHKQQNKHRMDIHHLAKTMGDGVTPLPSHFHHGTDFGVVVKNGEILAYGVSKKEARPLLKEGGKYISDCLHPDFGKSKIDRKAFGKWRNKFWKYVANLIVEEKENGTYNPFSQEVPEVEIFSVPSSQELEF